MTTATTTTTDLDHVTSGNAYGDNHIVFFHIVFLDDVENDDAVRGRCVSDV